MNVDLESILGIFVPIIFILILAGLGQLPVLYAGIKKLIDDANAARKDGVITPEEFDQFIKNLTNIVLIIRSGYLWIYENYVKRK